MGASLEREPEAVHLDQGRRPDPRTARTTNPTNQRRGTLGLLWAYRRKLLNDQSLLILQWWFVLTFWHIIDLTSVHAWYGLLAFLPLILMSILVVFLWRLTGERVAPPRRLVLLRTFGSRRRSTQLLQDLTRRWRWIGSVDLVSAPDIA